MSHAGSDYTGVTEAPGIRVTREAASMVYSRYRFFAGFCAGRDVLEVACGVGQGLGYLARAARAVVGGDITQGLLSRAREHYRERIPLVRLDAQELPFPDGSFDVVILNEAIYYLPDADRFLRGCHRVLRRGGALLVASINCEWPDFNPSPFSTRYFAAGALQEICRRHGFETRLYAGFRVPEPGVRDLLVSGIKRAAVRLRLIPGDMKRKELLKRLFLGRLVDYPAEVSDDLAAYDEPQPLDPGAGVTGHKVLYAVGTLEG